MSWNYNDWIDRVENMAHSGTEEGMRNLYEWMRSEGGSEDDIRRLDNLHNDSFSILRRMWGPLWERGPRRDLQM